MAFIAPNRPAISSARRCLHPVEGRYKVFLIQDAHKANASFANKLLKTLEEPPAHVVLCLTAQDRSALLPTIVSRCQVLALRPLGEQAVEDALRTRWEASPQQAALLARLLQWTAGMGRSTAQPGGAAGRQKPDA